MASADGKKLLENPIIRLGLSARAHDRILKVACPIADLEGTENIASKHLSEAIQYRTLDRSYGLKRAHLSAERASGVYFPEPFPGAANDSDETR